MALSPPQEQQLKAQQMILQQQLMAAAGANNAAKTKEQRAARRVYVGNLQPHMVSDPAAKRRGKSAFGSRIATFEVPSLDTVKRVLWVLSPPLPPPSPLPLAPHCPPHHPMVLLDQEASASREGMARDPSGEMMAKA